MNPIVLQSIKETNYRSILYTIEEQSKISRTEIAHLTALSPSTVTNACDRLLKKGLILEISRGFSFSGRKPIFLEINPNAGEVIGIVIRRGEVKVVVSDLKCEFQVCRTHAVNGGDDPTEVILSLTERMIAEYRPHNVMGIGVALDREYDYSRKRTRPIRRIDAEVLKERLCERFRCPVTIEKYLDLCAVAESYFYYANNYRNLLYVRLDEDISAGILVNGSTLKNHLESAGEIGHINFQYGGPICLCGRNGCVHSFCSTSSLIQTAIQGIVSGQSKILAEICENDLNNVNENTIMEAIRLQDGFSIKAVSNYVDYIFVLLDTLSQLYMPQVVILDGKVGVLRDIFTDLFVKKTSQLSYNPLGGVIVDFSHLKDNAAAKGACKAALFHALSKMDLDG